MLSTVLPRATRASTGLQAARRSAFAQRTFASSSVALAKTLLFLEAKKGEINPASLVAATAATKVGGDIDAFVVGGKEVDKAVDHGSKLKGIKKILFTKDAKFDNLVAEPVAPLLKNIVEKNGYTHVFAGHTAIGKDVIARASALLDVSQISDIIAVESEDTFQRPIYAGNALLTLKSNDKVKVVTVRGTAFDQAALDGGNAEKEEVKAVDAAAPTSFIEEQISKSARPELSSADKVVSGGRALKSAENFKKYIEPLADSIGAAVGASRAAVDSGFSANNLQVGQTGQIVAPSLYIAVGISGAIQHLAGMKDSKMIVSINKDPDAPMASVADYSLHKDLFEAVPELTEKLKNA